MPVSIVRPFNTYGPRQSARAVIPSVIIQLLNGKENIRLGSLDPTRDFVYVADTVMGFIKIAESKDTIGKEINIATEKEISIGETALLLINKINPKAKILSEELRVRPVKSEVERLCGSATLLSGLTKWKPTFSFEDGINETINWFQQKENLLSYKADIYNL